MAFPHMQLSSEREPVLHSAAAGASVLGAVPSASGCAAACGACAGDCSVFGASRWLLQPAAHNRHNMARCFGDGVNISGFLVCIVGFVVLFM